MKSLIIFISAWILASSAFGQTKPITAEEYDAAFEKGLVETNQQFPFILTFTSETFEKGTAVVKTLDIAERQSEDVERQTFSTVENGKESLTYQLRTGPGENVYCSEDGKNWTGPQFYECSREVTVYGNRNANSIEYTLEEKTVSEKKVKLYRKYEIYGANTETEEFNEDIAVIGENGLFVTTIQTLGTIKPKSVITRMTNSWKLNAKIEPIMVPERVAKPSESKPQTIRITKN